MTSALIDRLAVGERLPSGTSGYVLNCLRLPGRLTYELTAQLGGLQVHDIPLLIKAGLLKPLGGGPRNCVKYFAATEVERNFADPKWLDKATKVISRSRKAAKESEVTKSQQA